jgi:hypothetical protein
MDSLFDTRITILSLLNPTHARHVVKGNYLARTSDSFGHLTHEIFRHIYRDRDNAVLHLSEMTSIVSMLSGTMTDMNYEDLILDGNGDVKLIVNVYPYDLNENEIEILRESLLLHVRDANNIIVMREENISVKWLDDNCSVVVMYDGLEWLWKNISEGNLTVGGLIDTNMIIPNLFPTDKEIVSDDLETIYKSFSTMVNLAIIDTYHFSLRPPNKKE